MSLAARRSASSWPPWKIGCVSEAPMPQIEPALDSAPGQLNPPLPIEAVRLSGKELAVASPHQRRLHAPPFPPRMSGREASRSDGTSTGTCGSVSAPKARSGGAWSGVRPSSTASAWRVDCHSAYSPGSEASRLAASRSASSARLRGRTQLVAALRVARDLARQHGLLSVSATLSASAAERMAPVTMLAASARRAESSWKARCSTRAPSASLAKRARRRCLLRSAPGSGRCRRCRAWWDRAGRAWSARACARPAAGVHGGHQG